jgi:hypothetical protein
MKQSQLKKKYYSLLAPSRSWIKPAVRLPAIESHLQPEGPPAKSLYRGVRIVNQAPQRDHARQMVN